MNDEAKLKNFCKAVENLDEAFRNLDGVPIRFDILQDMHKAHCLMNQVKEELQEEL